MRGRDVARALAVGPIASGAAAAWGWAAQVAVRSASSE
jgi:hypothetical protein